jgi:alkanesulfonate monooxygenase SsuD/methylene tetrahydromethanopterin reductase-like flavin-dependent oxidoreductase (luciferase family)
MEVGILQIMQSFAYQGVDDGQVYDEELRLAVLADELGYDHCWVVEHHFEDYSFCPDNFVYLAHLAGRTRRIGLATGAVIVPWNAQPLRVAEKAALLDHLSGGRLILGLGRGLSRREFGQFGIPMDESRERFDEAAPMILAALESGVMEAHEGKHYRQPRASIRPRPFKSFVGRTTQVAMSPDSVEEAAALGVQMMAFNYKPKETQKAEYEQYRRSFRARHGGEPRPLLLTEMTVCDSDAGRAREHAERYVAGYCLSVMHHYEMMGEHYASAKGYASYGAAAAAMREAGLEKIVEAYVAQQIWGTPDQMLRRFEERRAFLGDTGVLACFRFAGMPYDVAERSCRLFAREVMPVLKSWETGAQAVRAAG